MCETEFSFYFKLLCYLAIHPCWRSVLGAHSPYILEDNSWGTKAAQTQDLHPDAWLLLHGICTVLAASRILGVETCARACRCEARWGLVPEKTRPERRNSPGTCHTFDSSAARQPQAGSKNGTRVTADAVTSVHSLTQPASRKQKNFD